MGSAWTDALEGLLAGEDERLVARVHQPGHPAERVPIPDDLHPAVVAALERRGIDKRYFVDAMLFGALVTLRAKQPGTPPVRQLAIRSGTHPDQRPAN